YSRPFRSGGFRRRSGLQVRCATNVESINLDEQQAMVVYRTLQEALTNILKHAHARSVRVDLVVAEDEISLEVSDDGIGLTEADREKDGSFGIRGLAERARRAGGWRSEEHTSELQSRGNLVCRLLIEK